ncbi:hypothetical protein DXX93_03280 [Thalassotalea euphylliae]|uniref:CHASE3 domain-containing protein n=1 Tax=Thalassotalea euphylliae TaxID=1655234 RepID=A0A3E0TNK3_9GAMM|nr:hypothetical protein [Thalassotalea euphylliae]REL25672.1 hypothetical protein DXX93_03280 [Thalassotalea euphylliae]
MISNDRLKLYYATSIVGLLIAVLGFAYNTWRLELSEHNSTVRTAAFELIIATAELEQNIFAAVYDDDPIAGSPRIGWVKVGLIEQLSVLIDPKVEMAAIELKKVWASNWSTLTQDKQSLTAVEQQLVVLQSELKQVLKSLN